MCLTLQVLEPVQDALIEYLALPSDFFSSEEEASKAGKVLSDAFQMRVMLNNKLSTAAVSRVRSVYFISIFFVLPLPTKPNVSR